MLEKYANSIRAEPVRRQSQVMKRHLLGGGRLSCLPPTPDKGKFVISVIGGVKQKYYFLF